MVLRVAVAYVDDDDDDATAAATINGLGTPMFFTIGMEHGLDIMTTATRGLH